MCTQFSISELTHNDIIVLWKLSLIFISVRCRNSFDRITVGVAVSVDVARVAPVAAATAAAAAALSTADAAVTIGQTVVEPRKQILQHSPVDTCAPAHGDALTPPQ